jgi:hypothetical protein
MCLIPYVKGLFHLTLLFSFRQADYVWLTFEPTRMESRQMYLEDEHIMIIKSRILVFVIGAIIQDIHSYV